MRRRLDTYTARFGNASGLFVPKSSRGADCQRWASLTWERPSVSVHWRPPLAVAIVTHLVTRLLAGFGLTTWLQSTPGLSESVAHLVLRYECVRRDRPMSDPVVVSFGGQCLPHVRAV